jgi:hypothetical protein
VVGGEPDLDGFGIAFGGLLRVCGRGKERQRYDSKQAPAAHHAASGVVSE